MWFGSPSSSQNHTDGVNLLYIISEYKNLDLLSPLLAFAIGVSQSGSSSFEDRFLLKYRLKFFQTVAGGMGCWWLGGDNLSTIIFALLEHILRIFLTVQLITDETASSWRGYLEKLLHLADKITHYRHNILARSWAQKIIWVAAFHSKHKNYDPSSVPIRNANKWFQTNRR